MGKGAGHDAGILGDRSGDARRRHRLGRAESAGEAQRDEPDAQRRDDRGADALDADDGCGVLVLTGAGESFSAGMDLKEYFREVDGAPRARSATVRRDAASGSGGCCAPIAKPTIAMVNGWCFGGAFTRSSPATSRSPPTRRHSGSPRSTGGSRPGASSAARWPRRSGSRAGLLYVMTGRTFDGRRPRRWASSTRASARGAARRGRGARPRAAREEPGRAARGEARLQALPAMSWDRRRGLPLREARAVAVPRPRARPRAGPRAVPRREEDQAGPSDLPAAGVRRRTWPPCSPRPATRARDADCAPPRGGAHRLRGRSRSRSARFAGLLRDARREPGDRVGIVLPNAPDFVAAYYGALRAGAIAVPLNPLLKPLEIRLRLEHAGAGWLVAAPPTRGGDSRPRRRARRRRGCAEPAPRRRAGAHGRALAVMLYTSGTSGDAKGAELTPRRAPRECGAPRRAAAPARCPTPCFSGHEPLSHVLGQSGVMNSAILVRRSRCAAAAVR